MLVDYVPVAELSTRAGMIARQKEIRRRQEEAARHVPAEREARPISHEAIAVIAPLKPSLPDPLAHLPRSIIRRVAEKYGVTYADIIGTRRFDHLVSARHEAIRAVRLAHPTYSTLKLGRIFGGRDHTTILHALRNNRAPRPKVPPRIGQLSPDAPTPHDIISGIAEQHSVPAKDIAGRAGSLKAIAARWEAVYAVRIAHPDLTFRQISEFFDGRCPRRLQAGFRRHRALLAERRRMEDLDARLGVAA